MSKAWRLGRFTRAVAVVIACGIAACSNAPEPDAGALSDAVRGQDDNETPRTGMTAEPGGNEEDAADGGEHGERRDDGEHGERGEGEEHGESGEHQGGEGEGHDEGGEGEESGVYIGRAETWDVTRRGARLTLTFDPTSGAFKGTVENTTEATLCAVRVEVHLSSGVELGPTVRHDVRAGETSAVELPTGGERFDTWTAHPEMSRCSGG